MGHPLLEVVKRQKQGDAFGVYSACTANKIVIEAVFEHAQENNRYAVVEATANQVNQFGGYTGMTPADYRDFVYSIAQKIGFNKSKIILGGDHLGPLTWSNENEHSAMEKAKELIRQYVLAGFTKIHIDTSMGLLGDDRVLKKEVIARRAAELCIAAEDALAEMGKEQDTIYIVGSEVPVPGGTAEAEELSVTTSLDFEETVETFKKEFYSRGLKMAWEKVIGVVVQPGVEFSDDTVHDYDRSKATDLAVSLRKYGNIVFEGHSTDYQTKTALGAMLEDGVGILKVGPALTFALREGLFALSYIEKELIHDCSRRADFIETLDKVMISNPSQWQKYYHGDEFAMRYARKYSYSDRCRYYLPHEAVEVSVNRLIDNLNNVNIPLTAIKQFLPMQYDKIRNGKLRCNAESLLKDKIKNCLDNYI